MIPICIVLALLAVIASCIIAEKKRPRFMPFSAVNVERIIGRHPNGDSIANLPATLPKAREPKPQADPKDLKILSKNLHRDIPNSFVGNVPAFMAYKPLPVFSGMAKAILEKPVIPEFEVGQTVWHGTVNHLFRVKAITDGKFECQRRSHHQVPGAIQIFDRSQIHVCD